MVGVVPDLAAQHAGVRHGADVDRDAGFGLLQRIVPVDRPVLVIVVPSSSVRIDDRAGSAGHGFARIERAVFVEVIGRYQAAGNADAVRQTVQRRRLIHVGQVARRHRVEVVVERRVERRNRADVAHRNGVFERRARQCRAAADHDDFLDDRQLLHVTDDHHRGFGTRGRVAVAVGQRKGTSAL